MDQSLTELLMEIPDEIFFDDKGNPNFNGIFVELARIIYREPNDGFAIPARDFLTEKLPNLSSFQRAVSKERRRRAGEAERTRNLVKNNLII